MRITLLFLLLISTSAFSADTYYYYWTTPYGGLYPSGVSACNHVSVTYGQALVSMTPISDGAYVCMYSRYPDGKIMSMGSVERHGSGCPDNQTLEPTQGVCTAPPGDDCASKKGTTANFTFNSNTDMPPQSVPLEGCVATVTKGKCSYISSGKAVCNGTAEYTGVAGPKLSIGDAAECPGGTCPDKSLDAEKQSQDCVYITNGNGVSSCTAQNYDSNPGKAQCGDVNGAYTCIENPKATSTKSTLTSTKTPTSNSDGTVTIVKDNTVTTISCAGKTCTTSVTTSKGTTSTNSSGQVTGNTSSCTGKNCSATGEATPSTGSASGNGTGTGDGKGEDESDGDSPSVGTLKEPTAGSFDGQENDWDSKINSAKTKLHDAVDKLKNTFKPVGDISLNSGAKLYCPSPVEIPLLNVSLDICIDKYADSLSWISDAIFAVCAMIALFIVFA